MLVKNPGIPIIQTSSIHQNIKTEDIETALKHLYGFNLGFAAEQCTDSIRSHVTKLLLEREIKEKALDEIRDCNIVSSLRESIGEYVGITLNDGVIAIKAERYADYKKAVESRAKDQEFSEIIL